MQVSLAYVAAGRSYSSSVNVDNLDIADIGFFQSVAALMPDADPRVLALLNESHHDYVASTHPVNPLSFVVSLDTPAREEADAPTNVVIRVTCDLTRSNITPRSLLHSFMDRHNPFRLSPVHRTLPSTVNLFGDVQGLSDAKNVNVEYNGQKSVFDYFNDIVQSPYVTGHSECSAHTRRFVLANDFRSVDGQFEFVSYFSAGVPMVVRVSNAVPNAEVVDLLAQHASVDEPVVNEAASPVAVEASVNEGCGACGDDCEKQGACKLEAESPQPAKLPNKAVKKLLKQSDKMLADSETMSKRAKRKLAAASAIVRDTGALIGPRVLEHTAAHRITRYTCVTKDRGVFASKSIEHVVNVAEFHKRQLATVFSQLPILSGFAIGPNFYVKTGRTTAIRVHSHVDHTPCDMKKVTFGLKTKVMASTSVKLFF